jgi:diaminopimelate dehydrogenase
VAGNVAGVRDALATELPAAGGRRQRYLYLELEPGVALEEVEQTLMADPLFLEEETIIVPVESIAALEETGHGVLLERRGTAGAAPHRSLLLEGRYSEAELCATVMVAAARALPSFRRGARTLQELPLTKLCRHDGVDATLTYL